MKRTPLRRWLQNFTFHSTAPSRKERHRARLAVEALEERAVPTVSISDAAPVTEGNMAPTGSKDGSINSATFTVSLSAPNAQDVLVNYATSNGTANGVRLVRLASGLSQPIAVTTAPGDDNRIFIAEKVTGSNGRIRIYNRATGQLQSTATPFLTIPGVSTGNEQGLLGLTFDPNYQTNGYFYVNFTTNTAPAGVISGAAGVTIIRRYQVSANPDIADAASATNLMVFAQPQTNHNGGWLEFGPDGFLYIATGDGGAGNDQGTGHIEPTGNGQFITDTVPTAGDPYHHEWLGKILRIDPNGGDDFPADDNRNYHNPSTNPFVGIDGADEIWNYGVRNPFRNGFDRLTGDLWIGDVGQNVLEEIDFQPAGSAGGQNYGWRLREGTQPTPGVGGARPAGALDPIFELPHGGMELSQAIIGGYVYRGPIPELQGMYFFGDGDMDSGRVWTMRYTGTTPFDGTNFTDFARWSDNTTTTQDLLVPDAGSLFIIFSFGQDNQGNLLIADASGEVFQITEGGDFGRVRGSVLIPAGQTSTTITVPIVGDRIDEADETFFVDIVSVSGGGETIGDGQGQGTINDDDGVSALLTVSSFSPTSTGFTATFNRPIVPGDLDLYSDTPDLTFVGSQTGPVRGTLVVDPSGTRITFVRTGGPLPTDYYVVTLRSASDAFHDPAGVLLDGNFDGSNGSNFVGGFQVFPLTVSAPTVTVSLPEFARGPGQAVNLPADSVSGLPVTITNPLGVQSVRFNLNYDPNQLAITGAILGPDAPANANVSFTPVSAGVAAVTFTSPAGLTGTSPLAIISLVAQVPDTATYGAKQVLDISGQVVSSGTGILPSRDDDGVHAAVYLGDLTGNARITSSDASQALQLAVGRISAPTRFTLTDPAIIGDINDDNRVASLDATRILQEAIGIDQVLIPNLPVNPPNVPIDGPDPLLNIPKTFTGRPGDTIVVPINLDIADGLVDAQIALVYDATRLDILSEADVRPGTLFPKPDVFIPNLNRTAGELRVGVVKLPPTGAAGVTAAGGSLIEITFRIRADAPAGPAIINLRNDLGGTSTLLNEGGLVLNPPLSNAAGDELDGLITVLGSSVPKVDSVVVNDGAAQRSLVTSVTVTFSTRVSFASNPAAAFQLTGPRGLVPVSLALSTDAAGTRTVARLTFSGTGIVNGSLADGRYSLVIDGDQISDAGGVAVDGDNDGTAGGDARTAFFRLYGDSDGDGDVDRTDVAAMLNTLGRRAGQAGFLSYLDFDGNGVVGVADALRFALRVGRRV